MLALILAATLSIEDYASMPYFSSPRLSPDAKRVAYVLTTPDIVKSAFDADLWLVDADGSNQLQLTRGEVNDSYPRWSPDGRTLAFLSDRAGRNQIFLIDPNGGEARQLTKERMPIREFAWSPDGKSIAFLRQETPSAEDEQRVKEKTDSRVIGEGKRHAHLYVIDLETGKVNRLTTGGWSIWSFSWAPDGTHIAFDRAPGLTLDDMYRSDIYVVPSKGGDMRPLVVRPGIDRGPRWSPDGRSIAFTSGGGVHDWLVEHLIHVVAAEGGKPRNIGRAYDRTPESLHWTSDAKALRFHGPFNSTSQLFRIDVDSGSFTNVSNFAGYIDDPDFRGDRAVFIMQSLTSPPEIYVSEANRFTPRALTNHNAKHRSRHMAPTTLIRWKNPNDGLEIEGLLTLPLTYKAGQKIPLITFVHGGPASSFEQTFLGYLGWYYAPEVLAAKGFAVLRPNPRGSGGYGEKFRQANRNDWGGADWIDINAGIDKVIAEGIADPQRLGMMGWSYGGFIASWAIGRSDRFKAISIGAPVVDLLSFHGTSDIRDFLPHYFDQRVDPVDDASLGELRHAPLSFELLRKHSPLWNLKKTNAKVFIQHGENDDRVPFSQGLMLYRVLDELGVDVTMVAYPRSTHQVREPKLRIDLMKRNVEFFEKNLSPSRTTPSP